MARDGNEIRVYIVTVVPKYSRNGLSRRALRVISMPSTITVIGEGATLLYTQQKGFYYVVFNAKER